MARKTFSKQNNTPVHTKIIVRMSCEGKTEVNYFEALNRTKLYEKYSFKTCYDKSENRADDVVKRLFTHWPDIDYKKDILFAVYDKDENTKTQLKNARHLVKQKIEELSAQGIENEPKIIFSNPCFEIWFYWHFETNAATKTADNLKNFCENQCKKYKEAPSNFINKLEKNRTDAMNTTKRILSLLIHDNINPEEQNANPNTNMHEFFERLEIK